MIDPETALREQARQLAHNLRRQNASAYPGLLPEDDIARCCEAALREVQRTTIKADATWMQHTHCDSSILKDSKKPWEGTLPCSCGLTARLTETQKI